MESLGLRKGVPLLCVLGFVISFALTHGPAMHANDHKCTWQIPEDCQPPSYKINIIFVDESSFPRDLKRSVYAAADYWSRAIVARPNLAIETIQLSREENDLIGWKRDSLQVEGILIFFQYKNMFHSNEWLTLAMEQKLALDVNDKLPRVSLVTINKETAGTYDRCDWTNIILHEMAHSLGFGATSIPSTPYSAWMDGSHWSPTCFANELMLPTYSPYTDTGREPISRYTILFLGHKGYKINSHCWDDNVPIMRFCGLETTKRERGRHRRGSFWSKGTKNVLRQFTKFMRDLRLRSKGRKFLRKVKKFKRDLRFLLSTFERELGTLL